MMRKLELFALPPSMSNKLQLLNCISGYTGILPAPPPLPILSTSSDVKMSTGKSNESINNLCVHRESMTYLPPTDNQRVGSSDGESEDELIFTAENRAHRANRKRRRTLSDDERLNVSPLKKKRKCDDQWNNVISNIHRAKALQQKKEQKLTKEIEKYKREIAQIKTITKQNVHAFNQNTNALAEKHNADCIEWSNALKQKYRREADIELQTEISRIKAEGNKKLKELIVEINAVNQRNRQLNIENKALKQRCEQHEAMKEKVTNKVKAILVQKATEINALKKKMENERKEWDAERAKSEQKIGRMIEEMSTANRQIKHMEWKIHELNIKKREKENEWNAKKEQFEQTINHILTEKDEKQNEWEKEKQKYEARIRELNQKGFDEIWEEHREKLKNLRDILSQSHSPEAETSDSSNGDLLQLREELRRKCIDLSAANRNNRMHIEKIHKMESEKNELFQSTQNKINELQNFISSQKRKMTDKINKFERDLSESERLRNEQDIKIKELTRRLGEHQTKRVSFLDISEDDGDGINECIFNGPTMTMDIVENDDPQSDGSEENIDADEMEISLIAEEREADDCPIEADIPQKRIDEMMNTQATTKVFNEWGEEQYEVKAIHGKITTLSGEELYLTEWCGYKLSECTWEPNKGMDCPAILNEFHCKLIENNNTICTKHTSKGINSMVPCWWHKGCNNKGFKDLRKEGIKYKLP